MGTALHTHSFGRRSADSSLLVFFVVKQQTAAIVERFGRFLSIRQSGLTL